MNLRLATIAAAVVFPLVALATAHAAGVGKKKVDRNKIVRSQIKSASKPKFEVIVPKDESIRAIHIVTPKGKLLSVPTDGFRLGGKVTTQATNQCGPNKELWTNWVSVEKCCREDSAARCTATQQCKQDVSTCMNPDGKSTYTATGAPYQCLPLDCPPAGTQPTEFATTLPDGF